MTLAQDTPKMLDTIRDEGRQQMLVEVIKRLPTMGREPFGSGQLDCTSVDCAAPVSEVGKDVAISVLASNLYHRHWSEVASLVSVQVQETERHWTMTVWFERRR